ncbi:oligosaccharide flippase family protein [uncultured Clostridium sp.]|uniref:oligosaccharide flippase family protein n=1 Tax=uncultured Clostridium sp. TaxID=59620 RepID=UPI0025D6B266|nr:oligosaccharide flippase family protein [uncultured Clostridium sp.]
MIERKRSIKINAMLNVIKVGLSVIFPLITFPYISRVLQVDNLGKINYSNSIISYFLLLSAMGVTSYAIREGAKIRDDEKLFNQFASEVFSVNVITTIVAYILLILLVLAVPKFHSYFDVIMIQSFSIVFTTLGIEWINNIYEDYLYITIRSIVIQVLSLICLFIFVKTSDDYLIYAGIMVFSSGLVCIFNLIHCRKFIKLKLKLNCNIKKHLKPMIIFFSNTIAVTIYVSADTTMLGWFKGDYYTGLYAVSVKIYQVVKQLLTAVYMVTISRLSNYAEKESYLEYKNLLTEICSFLLLIMLPVCTGVWVLAEKIIIVLSGVEYMEAAISLKILAIALFFAVASGVLVNCFNTPLRREKISLKATIFAAIANIILNIFFIPIFYQNGAAFTTVVSEMLVCIICIYYNRDIKKFIDLEKLFTQLKYAIIESILIIGLGETLSIWVDSSVLFILIVMILSFVGYSIILIVGKNEYAISMLELVKKKRIC